MDRNYDQAEEDMFGSNDMKNMARFLEVVISSGAHKHGFHLGLQSSFWYKDLGLGKENKRVSGKNTMMADLKVRKARKKSYGRRLRYRTLHWIIYLKLVTINR